MTDPAGPGLVVVLSGPSGVGKDSVLAAALARDDRLARVVTAKTRAPRPGEVDGVHHLFLSPEEFDDLLARGGLLEHAEVYGHYSGVPRDQVEQLLGEGKTVVLRTDVQGARTLRVKIPQALLVFLTVPGVDDLERRMRARAAATTRPPCAAASRSRGRRWPRPSTSTTSSSTARAASSPPPDELLAVIDRERARPGRVAPRL